MYTTPRPYYKQSFYNNPALQMVENKLVIGFFQPYKRSYNIITLAYL